MTAGFENYIDEYTGIVNERLNKLLSPVQDRQNIVRSAMRYSAGAKGKRVRPILVLEFCRILGGDYKAAVDFACALEMIHTYSLIHDDLPCMDDDDLRRGKPSCHIKFGEANALLAGDALLTMAFGSISNAEHLGNEAKVKAVSALAESAGINGMIGGQVIDLEYENRQTNEEILDNINLLKTGALLSCSCKLGAIAAGASDEQITTAGNFGEKLGLAFQVVDDILDVTASQNELGKPIGSDAQNGKTTYVSLCGIENAKNTAVKYTNQALDILNRFDNTEFLSEYAKKLLGRTF